MTLFLQLEFSDVTLYSPQRLPFCPALICLPHSLHPTFGNLPKSRKAVTEGNRCNKLTLVLLLLIADDCFLTEIVKGSLVSHIIDVDATSDERENAVQIELIQVEQWYIYNGGKQA